MDQTPPQQAMSSSLSKFDEGSLDAVHSSAKETVFTQTFGCSAHYPHHSSLGFGSDINMIKLIQPLVE
jgi:hypothetical protein